MVRDESLSRSLMLVCFGIAAVLFFALRAVPSRTITSQPPTLPAQEVVPKQDSPALQNAAQLVVSLSARRVYLYRDGELKASYRVAVGQPGWETPTGSFKVLQMYRNHKWRQPITGDVVASGRDNPLGDRWIGFWSDGRYQIGFHGTNQEQLVGKAVSHGCLRMRNRDIRALYEQVSEGMAVIVRK